MYGFMGYCGEYVEGIETGNGNVCFECPKYSKGVQTPEDDLRGIKQYLCSDCDERENLSCLKI